MRATAYLALGALLAVACSGTPSPAATPLPSPTPVSHDILVSVAVRGSAAGGDPTLMALSAEHCFARNEYLDVGVGMQALISNPSGDVIGSARFATTGEITASDSFGPTECTFRVLVVNMPDLTSYAVEAAGRGKTLFTRAELESNDWTASLIFAATPSPSPTVARTATPSATPSPARATATPVGVTRTPIALTGHECDALPTIDPANPVAPSLSPDETLNARFPSTIDGQAVTDVTSFQWLSYLCVFGGQAVLAQASSQTGGAINLALLSFGYAAATVDGEDFVLKAFRTSANDGYNLIRYFFVLAGQAGDSWNLRHLESVDIDGKEVGVWTDADGVTGYMYLAGDTVFYFDGVTESQATKIVTALP
jgi:hypothetical protein